MGKLLGSRLFKVNDHLTISCRCEDTRYGFRHLATLMEDGWAGKTAKVCYLNRTWEAWEFQSVIRELGSKCSGETGAIITAFAKQDHYQDDGTFKLIANIAALGAILTDGSQAATNDWKARMIKAGLAGYGLEIPEDWDQLSEDEKTRRLDAVIAELKTPPTAPAVS